MKIYHFIAAVALATATLCSCGNADNYPEMMDRVIVIQGEGITDGVLKIKQGETCQLKGIIEPLNTAEGEIVWTSENAEIATVSEDGVVTAVNAGETIITATEIRKNIAGKGGILVKVTDANDTGDGSVVVDPGTPVDQSGADAPQL
jgi:hypothetical protein